jgi:hypothetical protein
MDGFKARHRKKPSSGIPKWSEFLHARGICQRANAPEISTVASQFLRSRGATMDHAVDFSHGNGILPAVRNAPKFRRLGKEAAL